jgi:hypothetical protein
LHYPNPDAFPRPEDREYAREHGVPHFHIEGPGYRCALAIATGARIVGDAPAEAAARAWAEENRALLHTTWREG